MISVYPSTETEFKNNGIKILKPLKANIRKEDNGDYYLEIKDTLQNIDYYQSGMIIRVPSPWGYQPFRLSNPKIENNKVSIKARHIYFDTANYIIVDSNVVDKNCNDALDHLNHACDKTTPFTFLSDIVGNNSYRCVRKSLEEAINGVIDRWGGHLVRDNFKIEVRDKIGNDNGIVISVGKNLQKLTKNEVWDNVVTKILPVGKDGLTLPETFLTVEEELYDIPYCKVVQIDQSNISEDDYKVNDVLDEDAYNKALLADLRNKATIYLEQNKFPKINYSVEAYLKDVSDVGDIIYVKHPKCKVDIKTSVIAIEYDCILEKYVKIEFGNFKNSLKNLLSSVTAQVTDEVSKSTGNTLSKMEKNLSNATNKILKLMGDSYVIYDGDKILVVDKLPKEEAKNVIMINNAGIGFSQNGIEGPFNSAWSIDGTLDMQTINVINLVADLIKGGTLKLGGEDNNNGVVEIFDKDGKLIGRIDNNGFSFKLENEVSFVNIETTINNIMQQLATTVDLTKNVEDTGKISMVSGFDTTAFELKIQNACQDFPSPFDFDDDYPLGSWLRVTYGDDSYNRYQLPPLALRELDGIYDEMNIKEGKISVTKRIGINENEELYLLDKEITTEYEDIIEIELKEGQNIIELESFPNAIFNLTYMTNNMYTNTFALKAELKASVEILNEAINMLVTGKMGREEAESMINLALDNIKIEVNNTLDSRLTKAQILLAITDGVSNAKITANLLELTADDVFNIISGNKLNMKTCKLTIESDNLIIHENGKIEIIDDATDLSDDAYLIVKSSSNSNQYNKILSYGTYMEETYDASKMTSELKAADIALRDEYKPVNTWKGAFAWLNTSENISSRYEEDFVYVPALQLVDYEGRGLDTRNQHISLLTSRELTIDGVKQNSSCIKKKNFELLEDGLKIVLDTDIYKYHFKYQKDDDKKHIGFVIGRSYRYSKEIVSEDNKCVDTYAMIASAFRAIQQQQEEINTLKELINQQQKDIELLKSEKEEKI